MTLANDTPVRRKRKVQVIVFTRVPDLRVLILRRPQSRGHIWQPVTGNVDGTDTSLVVAAARELAEETGIQNPLAVTDTELDFRYLRNDVEILERVIGVEILSAQTPVLSDEHVDYAWLPPAEAADRFEWEINKQGLVRVIGG